MTELVSFLKSKNIVLTFNILIGPNLKHINGLDLIYTSCERYFLYIYCVGYRVGYRVGYITIRAFFPVYPYLDRG